DSSLLATYAIDTRASHGLAWGRTGMYSGTTDPSKPLPMKYHFLSGRHARRKAFLVLVIFVSLSCFLLYYVVTSLNTHALTVKAHRQRVASLEKQILALEKEIVLGKRDLYKQNTVISDALKSGVPDEVRRQLEQVQRSLHSLAVPRFKHRPETSHLDCRRLFHKDKRYMAEVGRSRIVLVESTVLNMDCESIRLRVLRSPQPLTGYGIAFARIVHTDYEFLEEQLRANYSPENHYCYHVDSKSPTVFKERMTKLSTCLPNVYLTEDHLEVDGRTGKNVNFAHMACLKLLEKKGSWQYVVLQQTHDVVIRTNQELKRIFQALNGSNDVEIGPCPAQNYDQRMKWDAESLGVFHNSTWRPSSEALKTPLFIVKGAVQASLSREAVKWMTRVNLTKLIGQFNVGKQSTDEMLMSSLQIAEEWEMPGRFTRRCFLNDSLSYDAITRMVQWRDTDSQCKAGFLRHSVCVLGIEDLPFIARYRHILVNKMMPSFDYGAIACVSELLFNRTYLGQNDHPLNMTFYENLPTVRFHNSLNDTRLLCQALRQL
ncbi:hypothetical protein V3C99_013553, partial [Haemonchus contortus]